MENETDLTTETDSDSVRHILVVEDDTNTSEFLKEQLEDQGFQVEFTNDGAQVASALVDLNKKAPKTRRQRNAKAARQLGDSSRCGCPCRGCHVHRGAPAQAGTRRNGLV